MSRQPNRCLSFPALISAIILAATTTLARADAPRPPPDPNVLSFTVGATGEHYVGGGPDGNRGLLSLDLDSHFHVHGQHGMGLRVRGGGNGGNAGVFSIEPSYSFRIASNPSRGVGVAVALDAGLGAGAISISVRHCTGWFATSCTTTAREHHALIYGFATIRGSVRFGVFEIGLEVGARAGASPFTRREGDSGPQLLGGWFSSQYVGVLRMGFTFGV